MPYTTWLIPDDVTSQDLSLAVLDYTTSFGRPFSLREIIINFNDGATPPVDVAVTETITIYLDSAKGAIYDTILARVSSRTGTRTTSSSASSLQQNWARIREF